MNLTYTPYTPLGRIGGEKGLRSMLRRIGIGIETRCTRRRWQGGWMVERSAKRSADRSGEWRRERREGGGGRRAGGRGREGGRVGRELARENGVSARC